MHKNVNENMMNIEFNHYNLCIGQFQVKYTNTYILQFSLLEIFNAREKNSRGLILLGGWTPGGHYDLTGK